MIIYTAKYGDLIDEGVITPADLPAVWSAFPTISVAGDDIPFTDAFYDYFQNRQIGGETIPQFLMYLRATTLEVAELMPDGLYGKMLAAAVSVEQDETRTRKYYPAPNGELDTAYITGAEEEKLTKRREYESELDKAEHLMKEGLPLGVWILKRYEKCFMGVY